MADFEELVQKHDIKIVILSSPTSIASQLVVPIINAGIKGVLNFTSMPLNFPRGIFVENYDITTLAQKSGLFRQGARKIPIRRPNSQRLC